MPPTGSIAGRNAHSVRTPTSFSSVSGAGRGDARVTRHSFGRHVAQRQGTPFLYSRDRDRSARPKQGPSVRFRIRIAKKIAQPCYNPSTGFDMDEIETRAILLPERTEGPRRSLYSPIPPRDGIGPLGVREGETPHRARTDGSREFLTAALIGLERPSSCARHPPLATAWVHAPCFRGSESGRTQANTTGRHSTSFASGPATGAIVNRRQRRRRDHEQGHAISTRSGRPLEAPHSRWRVSRSFAIWQPYRRACGARPAEALDSKTKSAGRSPLSRWPKSSARPAQPLRAKRRAGRGPCGRKSTLRVRRPREHADTARPLGCDQHPSAE